MSKGSRAAQARAKRVLEEQRRQQRQARQRRIVTAFAAVAVVIAAATVMIAVKVARGDSTSGGASESANPDTPAVISALTAVPASVLDQVGTGKDKVTTPLAPVTDQPALSADGKPLVLYIGAEYCPYCAAQRWAVVAALARFGTFSGLKLTRSADAPEVFPNTPTPTFHGATYTSQYLTFQGVETSSNVQKGDGYAPLDKLTSQQQQIMKKLNAPPYVPKNGAGGIPFLDLGNKYIVVGSNYDPEVLKGKSALQIAQALSDPNSAIAAAVDGSANMITAAVCKLTNGQPGDVCSGPAATAFAGKL